jgi:hypothetical protein
MRTIQKYLRTNHTKKKSCCKKIFARIWIKKKKLEITCIKLSYLCTNKLSIKNSVQYKKKIPRKKNYFFIFPNMSSCEEVFKNRNSNNVFKKCQSFETKHTCLVMLEKPSSGFCLQRISQIGTKQLSNFVVMDFLSF